MKLTRSTYILGICSLLTIAITALKFFNPDLIHFNSGFVLVVLLTIFVREDIYTRFFAVVSIALIALSIVYSILYLDEQRVVADVLAVCVLVMSAFIVLHVKRLYRSIDVEKVQMNALYEFATEGIVLTNQKGEIVLVNPAALRLFKYEEGELLGKLVEVLIPGRFREGHIKYRESFHQAPSNRTMGHGRDLFAKDKFGKEFPVEVSLSYFKQKNEFYVIAFIVDITERKESERRLIEQKDQLEEVTRTIKKMNAELENKVEDRTLILKEALQELERSQKELSEALDKEKELSEIKSRFVSMASHEFRTPLSTVLSSASLISKYTKTEEQERRDKHIKRIKDSVKHLNDLLEDFLSLGKLEEGKVYTSIESFDVKEFLEDVTEEMKPILKPGQEIEVHHNGMGSFSTDKKLLKNVLINLISNAAKFSPEGSQIDVDAFLENKHMKVAIRDQGIGISEEDQQHLFSSFFRGKNALNIQGTGLGLHIVKRYLDLVDGKVHLQSNLGAGTTITIELPLLEA
jgi:PAS domain S-box-containing protein